MSPQEHRRALACVDWSKLHEVDAQALYTFAVLACRAQAGACFCGAHVTQLDGVKAAPIYPSGRVYPTPPEPGQWVRINWATSPDHNRICRFVRAGYVSEYPHEWTGFVSLDGEEKEFGPCLEVCEVRELFRLEEAAREALAIMRGGYQAKDRIAARERLEAALGVGSHSSEKRGPKLRVTAKRCRCGHIVHPLGGCHVFECDCKTSVPK